MDYKSIREIRLIIENIFEKIGDLYLTPDQRNMLFKTIVKLEKKIKDK